MEDQIVPEISLLRASKTRFTAYWRPCETFDQARYFRNTSRYFRNRITVQWERPAGYFRNAETVLRERLTFPDSPRIRESRCKRPQPNFLSYLLKELTAPAALPLFRRFLEGEKSEEHTSELQSLMLIAYAVFCFDNKKTTKLNY